MPDKRLCKIYRSKRKEGMYLFVDFSEDLERVPDLLLKQFGTPELSMTLNLGCDQKLARAETAQVLEDITEQGYYLQMPPRVDQWRGNNND